MWGSRSVRQIPCTMTKSKYFYTKYLNYMTNLKDAVNTYASILAALLLICIISHRTVILTMPVMFQMPVPYFASNKVQRKLTK